VTPPDLERRLVMLGASLDDPPAPDLVPVILERLRAESRAPRAREPRARSTLARWSSPRGRRLFASALVASLLLAGAAMAVTPTRHAVLDVLGLRGVAIERVPGVPPLPPRARLALGRRIPLADARHAAGFTALVPPGAAAAYLAHDVPGGRVSFLVGPLLVTEFRGTATPFILKVLGPGTAFRPVRINGQPGLYVSGSPHLVLTRDATGQVELVHVVRAGNVLFWQQGPLTIRIEGARTLSQARALAAGLAPIASASRACTATHPGGPRPPLTAMLNYGAQIGSPSDPRLYGNGVLWTAIPLRSYYGPAPRGPGISLKTPWFRARPGAVRVSGALVSGPPASFHADVGTPAEYGPTGFAASLLTFGRPGCWRVRATLAGRVLTVVLDVPSR
jgi:hypothetical protein